MSSVWIAPKRGAPGYRGLPKSRCLLRRTSGQTVGIRDEHPDHPILPGRDEEFAVSAAAEM